MRSTQCPKSVITPLSESYLESFSSLKRLGGSVTLDFDAKSADAMAVLEKEWQEERKYVEIEKNNI